MCHRENGFVSQLFSTLISRVYSGQISKLLRTNAERLTHVFMFQVYVKVFPLK